MINKDTKLYGSFSNNPGNNGCIFFNDGFKKYNINAIYKSFYSDDIEKTIQSVKHLNFSGFALSSPLKKVVYDYLDEHDESVIKIGASNTVIIKNGILHGYNTDWIGVYKFFENKNYKSVNIIGTGGFANAAGYAFSKLNIKYDYYDRNKVGTINDIENAVFLNATPLEVVSNNNIIIDARPHTEDGKIIFYYQAIEQFKLYTDIDYV